MTTTLNEIKAFYARAYSLEHTKRYSMIPVVHQESVASHSFFVALAVQLLHAVYDFNLEKALRLALVHDLGEIEISDINHAVKKKYPELARIIKAVEREAIASFPEAIQEDILDYADGSTIECMIVHYADTLQVVQYATAEVAMGNTGYMATVASDAKRRAVLLETKLIPYQRVVND